MHAYMIFVKHEHDMHFDMGYSVFIVANNSFERYLWCCNPKALAFETKNQKKELKSIFIISQWNAKLLKNSHSSDLRHRTWYAFCDRCKLFQRSSELCISHDGMLFLKSVGRNCFQQEVKRVELYSHIFISMSTGRNENQRRNFHLQSTIVV